MNVTRVFDLLEWNQLHYAKSNMVSAKVLGQWKSYSTHEFVGYVNAISRGLIRLGIQPKDRVAVMSPNRPEWNFCDFGIMQIGAVQVPMYPTLAEADIRFILNDAEVKIVFVATRDLYNKIEALRAEIPHLQAVYTFDEYDDLNSWNEVIGLGKSEENIDLFTYRSAVKEQDLLTLIYTSGTTGTPKGVMLTHANLVSNFIDCLPLLPKGVEKALSFLPLSHVFERMIVYMYFYNGTAVYYAESIDSIANDIKEVQPNGFSTVPRLLEKVYDKIIAKGAALTGIKRTLFFWALNLGLKFEPDGKNGWWYELQLSLANKIIFNKWREALGNHIRFIVSGGAALQPRLARVFWAARIPVIEGYGLTETSPVIAVNGFGSGELSIGTVGRAIPHVTIKIAPDGEILCKGPNIMLGYYQKPELTAEVIDGDGFFHTGDIGELINGGFLKITDRKKEVFKTAGGKYVAPQLLENKFKESVFIEQIMVIGENQRFPAALVVPAFPHLKDWCASRNLFFTSNEEMITNSEVKEKIFAEINRYNSSFGHWEQVKKIELLPKEWSIDGGELTPKLSLKRKVVLEKYADLVEKIYG